MWFTLLPAILPKWAGHHPGKTCRAMGYNNTEENPPSSISPQREQLSCWSWTYWFGPYWRPVSSFPMDSAGWCITRSKLITCWWQESLIQIHATVWLFVLFHSIVSGKTTNKPCWNSAEKNPNKNNYISTLLPLLRFTVTKVRVRY